VKDATGTPVRLGDQVTTVKRIGKYPRTGYIRAIGSYPGQPKVNAIRADDSTTGDIQNEPHTWSAWLKAREFTVSSPANLRGEGGAK
jgi:hypothetical protein